MTSRGLIITLCAIYAISFISLWRSKSNIGITNLTNTEEKVHVTPAIWTNSSRWIEEVRHEVFSKLPDMKKFASSQPSPACRPNLNVALPDWRWDNNTKFERLYLYHTRKAGGTSLVQYFRRVATYYNLEFNAVEWTAAEEPGTAKKATFYVTHLREPVDRAISHFKYEGRWKIKPLIKWFHSPTSKFIPTQSNGNSIETWNKTRGHKDMECPGDFFRLHNCAVNCYIQWISGLSCPQYNISRDIQYEVAFSRLHRYNFIVILEKLKDEEYVTAVEDFFGVEGITLKRGAPGEQAAREANALYPLNITNETMNTLQELNELDSRLYDDIRDCDEEYNMGILGEFATRIKKLDIS